VVLSVAALLAAAGCNGSGEGDRTAPTPPDHLTITIAGPETGSLRVDLDCEVADQEACARVVRALRDANDDESCVPVPDRGERITVAGRIGGRRFEAEARRRTDCEARVYDRLVAAALSPP
jgi:hypothetical protein